MRRPLQHLNTADDVFVVALAQKGDAEAFAELVRRHETSVRVLMYRCCGDAATADDLAQQTFLQAWKDIAQLRDVRRFAGWLKRLALNRWLKGVRGKDPLRDAQAVAAERAAPSDNTGLRMDLDRALATLAPAQRACVICSYHEGMSHAEIAAATGFALGTVKSHIRRATTQLRHLLVDYQQAAVPEIEES